MHRTAKRSVISLIIALAACSAPGPEATLSPPGVGQGGETPSAIVEQTPQHQWVLGTISYYNEDVQGVLAAPVTVRAGEAFPVIITTFGGSCEREGEVAVEMLETTVNLTVHNRIAPGPNVICTAELKFLRYSVTLRFDRPGAAIIRVHCRRVSGETAAEGVPHELEHRLEVK